jgi:hypothetical protein
MKFSWAPHLIEDLDQGHCKASDPEVLQAFDSNNSCLWGRIEAKQGSASGLLMIAPFLNTSVSQLIAMTTQQALFA